MMVLKFDSEKPCHLLKRKLRLFGMKEAGYRHRIGVSKIPIYIKIQRPVLDAGRIKFGIVCYQHAVAAKLPKLRKQYFYRLCVFYIFIPDTRKIRDPEGNRLMRIDEFRESVNDLTVSYLYGADLYDLYVLRVKACGLKIKYYKITIKTLPL